MPWYVVLAFLLLLSSRTASAAVSSSSTSFGTCEPVKVSMCKSAFLGYNMTRTPNLAGHRLQADANKELNTFAPLVQVKNKCLEKSTTTTVPLLLCSFPGRLLRRAAVLPVFGVRAHVRSPAGHGLLVLLFLAGQPLPGRHWAVQAAMREGAGKVRIGLFRNIKGTAAGTRFCCSSCICYSTSINSTASTTIAVATLEAAKAKKCSRRSSKNSSKCTQLQ